MEQGSYPRVVPAGIMDDKPSIIRGISRGKGSYDFLVYRGLIDSCSRNAVGKIRRHRTRGNVDSGQERHDADCNRVHNGVPRGVRVSYDGGDREHDRNRALRFDRHTDDFCGWILPVDWSFLACLIPIG